MRLQLNLKAFHRLFDTEPALVGENLEHRDINISISLAKLFLKLESDGSLDGNIGRSTVYRYLFVKADKFIGELLHWVVTTLEVLVILAVEIVDRWRYKVIYA